MKNIDGSPSSYSDDRWRRYIAPQKSWPKHDKYVCNRCNEPACVNPYDSEIIGCLKCQTTIRPAGYEKFLKQWV